MFAAVLKRACRVGAQGSSPGRVQQADHRARTRGQVGQRDRADGEEDAFAKFFASEGFLYRRLLSIVQWKNVAGDVQFPICKLVFSSHADLRFGQVLLLPLWKAAKIDSSKRRVMTRRCSFRICPFAFVFDRMCTKARVTTHVV